MKFSIHAFISALCLLKSTEAYWGKRSILEAKQLDNPFNRTECFFNKKSSVIECIGPLNEARCDAEFLDYKNEENYFQFVIAECQKNNSVDHWMIIPRKLDNSGFVSTYISMNGTEKPLLIWTSTDLNHYGLRIKEKECYDQLVNIVKTFQKLYF